MPQSAARSSVSRAKAERPLIRLNEHNTIETRFCVNSMVTKTDPKRLGGGEVKAYLYLKNGAACYCVG
jgi:hypothetical protein